MKKRSLFSNIIENHGKDQAYDDKYIEEINMIEGLENIIQNPIFLLDYESFQIIFCSSGKMVKLSNKKILKIQECNLDNMNSGQKLNNTYFALQNLGGRIVIFSTKNLQKVFELHFKKNAYSGDIHVNKIKNTVNYWFIPYNMINIHKFLLASKNKKLLLSRTSDVDRLFSMQTFEIFYEKMMLTKEDCKENIELSMNHRVNKFPYYQYYAYFDSFYLRNSFGAVILDGKNPDYILGDLEEEYVNCFKFISISEYSKFPLLMAFLKPLDSKIKMKIFEFDLGRIEPKMNFLQEMDLPKGENYSIEVLKNCLAFKMSILNLTYYYTIKIKSSKFSPEQGIFSLQLIGVFSERNDLHFYKDDKLIGIKFEKDKLIKSTYQNKPLTNK